LVHHSSKRTVDGDATSAVNAAPLAERLVHSATGRRLNERTVDENAQDDIDPHVLHLLNLFMTFVGHSRQDAALATPDEALAYCAAIGVSAALAAAEARWFVGCL
jgi:hypothetical protein